MSGGMLEGVRVVDLTSVVIGPLCTQILADHGAEVIKIESPEGDVGRFLGGKGISLGMAPKFLHLNRNKRSLCLDLKKPAAREALIRLIERADVMTWNVRPASMARLGLSYDEVRAINPRIIYCGMYGFGQGGRHAEVPAYDPIIQGIGGVAGLNARAFGTPRYLPYVLADRTAGLIAVQMIAMALFKRERTGQSQSIGVPMFENVATQVLTEHLYHQTYRPALGPAGDPRLVNEFYAPCPTQDGYVCIAANTNPQVFPLFDAWGMPELKTDPRYSSVAARFEHVHAFYALRDQEMARQPTAYWLEFCRAHDIPAAPYHTLETLVDDPHLHDVGFFIERDHPTEGRTIDLKPANEVSCGHRTDWLPAPHLGEHTREILAEIGLSESEVGAMIGEGAARSPD